MSAKPRYPIYVPSKGRADKLLTADTFDRGRVPYRVVVEPSQVAAYSRWAERGQLLVLPEDSKGLVYARNWIKEHSIAEGSERHWQFDDDISRITRTYRGYRLPCEPGPALAACEDFVDRYENVALASLNSEFFIPVTNGTTRDKRTPFFLNSRCYTCFLVLNSTPNRWRYRYNEDTDMSLQVLADGWCTVLFNAFLIRTPETMSHNGGQTSIYVNDGRLKMSRELERVWPGVVSTRRRFGRPQHKVKNSWRLFDTKLKLKPGVDLSKLPKVDERGMKLKAVSEVQSGALRKLIEEQEGGQ